LTSDRLRMSEAVNLRPYHISLDTAHTILARACLTVLLQLDETIDKKRLATFPLAFYAAQHWFTHAKREAVEPLVQDTMKQFFNTRNPYLAAWLWIHDVDRGRIIFRQSIDELADRPSPPKGTALYYAASCGFCGPTKYLISMHGEKVKAKSGYYGTPLHAASRNGHLDAVSLLLDYGADVNVTNGSDHTPLCAAYDGRHLKAMQLLLERGATVDIYYDSWGFLILDASCSGRAEVIRLLLQHNSEVNAIGRENWTPLHWTTRDGHADEAQILLEHGADINAISDHGTPLCNASRNGHLKLVRLLLEHKADLHIRGPDGQTPFQAAMSNRRTEIVQLLLEHGAVKE
jgi:ankyrin repeat protein